MSGQIKGKMNVEMLQQDIRIWDWLSDLDANILLDSYTLYTKLDIAARRILEFKIVLGKEWAHHSRYQSKGPLDLASHPGFRCIDGAT